MYKSYRDDEGTTIYLLPFKADTIDELVNINNEELYEFLYSDLNSDEAVELEDGTIFIGSDIQDSLSDKERKHMSDKRAEERTIGQELLKWGDNDVVDSQVESILSDPVNALSNYHIKENEILYKMWLKVDEDPVKFWESVVENNLEKELEEAVRESVWGDSDLFQIVWEDIMVNLSEILSQKNPDGHWAVTGKNMGWRNREGYKDVDTNDGSEFVEAIFPDTSDFSFVISEYGTDGIYIKLFHHDAPTGESYYVVPRKTDEDSDLEEEACKRVSLDIIEQFQKDAQSLGKDSNDMNELKRWLEADNIKAQENIEIGVSWVISEAHYIVEENAVEEYTVERFIDLDKAMDRFKELAAEKRPVYLWDKHNGDIVAKSNAYGMEWEKIKEQAKKRSKDVNEFGDVWKLESPIISKGSKGRKQYIINKIKEVNRYLKEQGVDITTEDLLDTVIQAIEKDIERNLDDEEKKLVEDIIVSGDKTADKKEVKEWAKNIFDNYKNDININLGKWSVKNGMDKKSDKKQINAISLSEWWKNFSITERGIYLETVGIMDENELEELVHLDYDDLPDDIREQVKEVIFKTAKEETIVTVTDYIDTVKKAIEHIPASSKYDGEIIIIEDGTHRYKFRWDGDSSGLPNFIGGVIKLDDIISNDRRKADKIEKIWVVTKPTSKSGLIDILFETTIGGLENQFKGGLSENDIVATFTTEVEAKDLAKKLLKKNEKEVT